MVAASVRKNNAQYGCAGQILFVTPRIDATVPITLASREAFSVFIDFKSSGGLVLVHRPNKSPRKHGNPRNLLSGFFSVFRASVVKRFFAGAVMRPPTHQR